MRELVCVGSVINGPTPTPLLLTQAVITPIERTDLAVKGAVQCSSKHVLSQMQSITLYYCAVQCSELQ